MKSPKSRYPKYYVAGPNGWTKHNPNNHPNIYVRVDDDNVDSLGIVRENGKDIGNYHVNNGDIQRGYLREVTLAELALCVTII